MTKINRRRFLDSLYIGTYGIHCLSERHIKEKLEWAEELLDENEIRECFTEVLHHIEHLIKQNKSTLRNLQRSFSNVYNIERIYKDKIEKS